MSEQNDKKRNVSKPEFTVTEHTVYKEFITRPLPALKVSPETINELGIFCGRSVSIEPDGGFKAGRSTFNYGDLLLWNGGELRVFTEKEVKEKLKDVEQKTTK